jgi:hypothetical protein
MLSKLTLWLTSPPSVFSNGLAASTVTDSSLAPTCSETSMRRTFATETITPVRTNFLNPEELRRVRTCPPAAEPECNCPFRKTRLINGAGLDVLRFNRNTRITAPVTSETVPVIVPRSV